MKKKLFFENVNKAIKKVQQQEEDLSEMEYFMELVKSLENELEIEPREIDHFINNEAMEIDLKDRKAPRKSKKDTK